MSQLSVAGASDDHEIRRRRLQFLDNSDTQANLANADSRGRPLDRLPVTASNGNTYYYMPLYMGSNRQPLNFLVDSGSAWLWVSSNECGKCTGGAINRGGVAEKFRGLESQSFRKTNRRKRVDYMMGYVQGEIVTDEVSITPNGNKERHMAEGTEFIYADDVGEPFNSMRAEGVLGLGPRAKKVRDLYNADGTENVERKDPAPFVAHLYKKKAIARNMFSIML